MQPVEQFFDCPYCGEKISMVLDVSAGAQQYVEDCEVCCSPITVSYDVGEEGTVEDFTAASADE